MNSLMFAYVLYFNMLLYTSKGDLRTLKKGNIETQYSREMCTSINNYDYSYPCCN